MLAHGFGGSARNFRPQARALAARYRVARFDARGHARSPAPHEAAAYTTESFAADLGRIVDRVGGERAVVGGLSMGAGTALRFALDHPERVAGLVLAAYPPGAGAQGGFASVALPFADAIEREGLDAAGARFVWGPASGLDPDAARLVRQGFLEHPPHGLALTLRGVIAAQPTVAALRSWLAALRLPALVVVGGEDRMSLAPSRELAGAIPGGRLVVIEGAGHVVNLAQPGAFNAALEQFLTDVA